MTTSSHLHSTTGTASRHRRMVATVIGLGALVASGSAVFASPATTPTTTIAPETTTTTTTPTTTVPPTTTTPTTTTTTPAVTAPAPTTVPATTVPSTTVRPTAPKAAPRNIKVIPEQIGHVLATIRYMESRGQYGIPPNKGNASGAYQFIASTWANYGGYAHAYLAPPNVQDERAAEDVAAFLKRFNNDVSMVPVMWYYPRAAVDPALMDIVPVPSAGNVLTIREYQQRWLGVFATISGQPIPASLSLEEAVARLALPPTPPERTDGLPSLEFPVLGPTNIAAPDCDTAVAPDDPDAVQSRADIEAAGLCTEAAPSIIFGVKLQPVRSATDGIVTKVDDEPGSGRPIAVTITDVSGRSYVYSGFNDDNPGTSDGNAPAHLRLTALADVGATVWAGQIIGFMGDTEPLPLGIRADVATDSTITIDPNAVAPHIRLSIYDLDGTPIDAFGPVVDSLFRTGCEPGIGTWSVPARVGQTKPVTIETTDENDDIDSEWVITSKGQVTASGWAALISPGSECSWTPADVYGPGAAGSNELPARWWVGVNLPTKVWLGLALADEQLAPTPFFRF